MAVGSLIVEGAERGGNTLFPPTRYKSRDLYKIRRIFNHKEHVWTLRYRLPSLRESWA